MPEFISLKALASDPGRLELSIEKLKRLHPELFGLRSLFFRYPYAQKKLNASAAMNMLREHLIYGDTRAAVVARVKPFTVAAYTDELDCVALLSFPHSIAAKYQLNCGDRLLTSNTYWRTKKLASDLQEGPAAFHRYTNFYPIIADFLSDDGNAIAHRKKRIAEDEWRSASQCAARMLRRPNPPSRDGRPLYSGKVVVPRSR